MSGRKVIQETLASVLAELERLDPGNLIAARAAGVLSMAHVEAPRARVGRPKAVCSEQDREIAAYYQAGNPVHETAAKFGVDPGTVTKAVLRAGGAMRSRGMVARPVKEHPFFDKMVEMRSQGATLQEIGTSCGVSGERIRQLFVKAGLPTPTECKPLRPEQLAAVADYVAGKSLNETAEALGVMCATAARIIKRAGHAVRPTNRRGGRHPKTMQRAERAAALYGQGLRVQDIADQLGLKKRSQVYPLLAIAKQTLDRNAPTLRAA